MDRHIMCSELWLKNNALKTWGRFHKLVYVQLLHRRSQRRKNAWVGGLFALLGSALVKASCKLVDKIDPRCHIVGSSFNLVWSGSLKLQELNDFRLSICPFLYKRWLSIKMSRSKLLSESRKVILHLRQICRWHCCCCCKDSFARTYLFLSPRCTLGCFLKRILHFWISTTKKNWKMSTVNYKIKCRSKNCVIRT